MRSVRSTHRGPTAAVLLLLLMLFSHSYTVLLLPYEARGGERDCTQLTPRVLGYTSYTAVEGRTRCQVPGTRYNIPGIVSSYSSMCMPEILIIVRLSKLVLYVVLYTRYDTPNTEQKSKRNRNIIWTQQQFERS